MLTRHTIQLGNIEKRTGKSLDAFAKIVKVSGLSKHGEIRDMLNRDLGMGHSPRVRRCWLEVDR